MESILLPADEFIQDAELRLGRANGNIFHRRDGVPGVNDGQVMVRLKKKRFVVLDYGVIPSEADVQAASLDPRVTIPEGAGKQKCVSPDCTKVGVPVLLYDSAPEEAASLYLRSGLCFSCQRNLNEKRRTVRKRKGYGGRQSGSSVSTAAGKKLKINGETVELSPDSVIINGPVGDAKPYSEEYNYPEIGQDLQSVASEVPLAVNRLVAATMGGESNTAVAVAAAVAAAGESEAVVSAVNAAVDASSDLMGTSSGGGDGDATAVSQDDISELYDKAFSTMSKGLYLLSQWKVSWDAAIAAAVAQETVNDSGLADAVASAAAAAAAASVEGHDDTANMIPLLLAAEQKGESKTEKEVKEVIGV